MRERMWDRERERDNRTVDKILVHNNNERQRWTERQLEREKNELKKRGREDGRESVWKIQQREQKIKLQKWH